MHNKIKELSLKRIKYFTEKEIPFYKWHQTFLNWLKEEIAEVENEIKSNNLVYLEDELWDIFWNYICLLYSFENEWKISSVENVLNRCYKKFSERIWKEWNNNWDWENIKKAQKEKLKMEHNKLYNND